MQHGDMNRQGHTGLLILGILLAVGFFGDYVTVAGDGLTGQATGDADSSTGCGGELTSESATTPASDTELAALRNEVATSQDETAVTYNVQMYLDRVQGSGQDMDTQLAAIAELNPIAARATIDIDSDCEGLIHSLPPDTTAWLDSLCGEGLSGCLCSSGQADALGPDETNSPNSDVVDIDIPATASEFPDFTEPNDNWANPDSADDALDGVNLWQPLEDAEDDEEPEQGG